MTEELPNQTCNDLTLTQEQYAAGYSRGFALTKRFLGARGVGPDTAEEAAQAAWSRAWERRAQLRDPKRLQPWVNTIALNLFRNGCRQRETSELPLDIPVRPLTSPRAIDLLRVLEKCKPEDREMLHKHYLAGYTSRELAAEGNGTASGVRVRLLRLRRRLQTAMTEKRGQGHSASAASSAFGHNQPTAA
jgi:RNA polymerase sigma-70 factor (ECF subfamily)